MRSIKITRDMVDMFCRSTDDSNAIHQGEVVPGMLIVSLLAHGNDTTYWLKDIKARFRAPIMIGDVVDIEEIVLDSFTKMKVTAHEIQYSMCVGGSLKAVVTAVVCKHE